MEAMKLHQRPLLIYNADETEIKLTYNSGNQKMLPVDGSEDSQQYSRRKPRKRRNIDLHE
jgi:hypothetical protein